MVPFDPPMSDITAAVRVLVGSPSVQVLDWRVAPVVWQVVSEVTGGLYRLTGTVGLDNTSRPWSLVVKVGAQPPGATGEAVTTWRREELAYTSGILKPQSGFATPRLLAVSRPSSLEMWLWLEDVVDEGDEILDVARHAFAARHLGVFNGSHLVVTPDPPAWLVRNWLPGLLPLVASDEASAFVQQPGVWRLPAVRAAFPTPVLHDLVRLAQRAPEIFDQLERLPRSLCHLDPGRFNLCVRQGAGGIDETVFLDWQMLGVGALGADLAMMNVLNLYRLYLRPNDVRDYSEMTLGAFLAGLVEAGVEAELEDVAYAYRAVAALRAAAMVRVVVHNLAKDASAQTAIPGWGARRGWGRSETWRAWGSNMRFLMTLL